MGYRGRAGGGVRVLSLGGQEVADPRVFSVRGTGGEGVSTPTMDSSGRVLVQPLGMRAAVAPQYSPVHPPPVRGFFQLAQVGEEGERGEGEADNLPMLPPPGLPQVVQAPQNVPPPPHVHSAPFFACSEVHFEAPQNVLPPPHVHSAPLFSPFSHLFPSVPALRAASGDPCRAAAHQEGCAQAALHEVHVHLPLALPSPLNVSISLFFSILVPFPADSPADIFSVPALRAASGDPGRAAAHQEGRAQAALWEVHWYDQVAGFWGQMGGPCLGMIPPGIDLGPALPKNCSGGNTKVYVNARELHRKDLDRLVKRGLPLTDNMAYRVEANGNVFDGLSGEFLVNLGKLAPS
ncbi:unnamed protein product [Closterium sp. NIES-64]|nr:unnamed protein product [Closterium sp. NIES-64]